MGAQRRDCERFQVDLELTLQSESTVWAGHAENVSDGGVFVVTKELKPIGTEIEVTITLPGENMSPIWALGVVCWIRDSEGKEDAPLGMGIQFRLITDEALRKVRNFVRDRQATNAIVGERMPPVGPKKP